MSDTDLICVCMTVTRGEIATAVRQGQTNIEQLKATLMCCTGCGTCQNRVENVIKETLAADQTKSAKKDAA